ncbi:MAG: GntR family transcriptional regulator [Kurthia sp.]|nr:GntR family transcriptional regulator [Kurthia sp.]
MTEHEKKTKIKQARYQIIAADLASKIVDREYEVGQKLYARSSLASKYGVSSEIFFCRAIAVLQDLGIVQATKGSGVFIKSYEEAAKFVHQLKDVQSVNEIQHDVFQSIAKQKEELERLEQLSQELVSRTNRFHSLNPFAPFNVTVTSECLYLDMTIQELNFWQNTTATIVGIRRGETILLSPGPYASIKENDVLYFIGNEASFDIVKNFLYKG